MIRDRRVFARVIKAKPSAAFSAGELRIYREKWLAEARRERAAGAPAAVICHCLRAARRAHHAMLRELGMLPAKAGT